MEQLSRKKIIIITSIIIVLAAAVALFFITRPSSPANSDDSATGAELKPEEISGEAIQSMEYRKLDDKQKVLEPTKPSQELPGPDKSVITKVFDLKIENGAYSFPQIVVKKGDRVQFRFTAIGSNQDLAMAYPVGAYIVTKKNEVSTFGFTADTPGTYEFGCNKACPAGSKATGKLIIQ